MLHTAPLTAYSSQRQPVHDLITAGRYRDALMTLATLRQSVTADLAMMADMAECLWALGEGPPARGLLTSATALAPEVAPLWARLGSVCLGMGDRKGALAAFERAAELDPNSAAVLSNLDRLHSFEKKSHKAQRIQSLAQRKSMPARDRALAWNTLGRIEDRAERPGPAFRCFAKSNALNGGMYQPSLYADLVEGLERNFEGPRTLLPPDPAARRMIFVVGMPRSGTTLAETILCRHPDVSSIGESPVLQDALNLLRRHVADATGDISPWNWPSHLTPELASDLRQWVLQAVAQRLPDTARSVIVDKLPLNLFDLGFAQAILPKARFVVMDRHPLDVGLSNYVTNFGDNHPYSQNLGSIAQVTRAAHKARQIYAERGLPFLDLSYRALVETPEPAIRALLDHVGLDWTPDCLTPEGGQSVVRTASVTQVRAPINRKALGRWRMYTAQLPGLINGLGPEWLVDWEARDSAAQFD